MRILFLTHEGGMAGSTFSLTYLAKGLAERGHQIFIGIKKGMPVWDLIEDHPNIQKISMNLEGKFDFNSWMQVKDLVKKEKIELINPQSGYDRYISIFTKRLFNLKAHVIHTRRQRPLSSLGRLHRAFYVKNTSGIVVISEGLKQIFVDQGYPSEHLQVIHNGLPPERFEQWSQAKVDEYKIELDLKEGDKVIGCVSRLKEQEQIIRAVTEINDPKIVLIFAGVFPEQIEPILDKYPIKNKVHLLGKLPNDEILNIYRLLDMNILASTMDGFGLVLLEAMAMSCPVIGTHFGGIGDVIEHEKNGLLFQNNDIEGLKKQIKRVLNDENLRNRLIENGKKTAFKRFTIENTLKNFESYFQSVINSNSAQSSQ